MRWLVLALGLPGKAAVGVGIVLWHLAGMEESGAVRLNLSKMPKFGITRTTAARGLKELEAAELIEVGEHNGRVAIVTLLDAPRADEEDPYAGIARRGAP